MRTAGKGPTAASQPPKKIINSLAGLTGPSKKMPPREKGRIREDRGKDHYLLWDRYPGRIIVQGSGKSQKVKIKKKDEKEKETRMERATVPQVNFPNSREKNNGQKNYQAFRKKEVKGVNTPHKGSNVREIQAAPLPPKPGKRDRKKNYLHPGRMKEKEKNTRDRARTPANAYPGQSTREAKRENNKKGGGEPRDPTLSRKTLPGRKKVGPGKRKGKPLEEKGWTKKANSP